MKTILILIGILIFSSKIFAACDDQPKNEVDWTKLVVVRFRVAEVENYIKVCILSLI